MDSWFVLVRMDNEWMWRWFVNDDYGKPIAMSCRGFWSEVEARDNLELYLEIIKIQFAV
jgi:hypothetical protein